MGKVQVTIELDEDVLRVVKQESARTGRHTSNVIEDAVVRQLSWDAISRIQQRNNRSEDEAMELALEAQRWARAQRE